MDSMILSLIAQMWRWMFGSGGWSEIQEIFSRTICFPRRGFKLVILDEADAMTQDAQNALRRGKELPSTVRWQTSAPAGELTLEMREDVACFQFCSSSSPEKSLVYISVWIPLTI